MKETAQTDKTTKKTTHGETEGSSQLLDMAGLSGLKVLALFGVLTCLAQANNSSDIPAKSTSSPLTPMQSGNTNGKTGIFPSSTLPALTTSTSTVTNNAGTQASSSTVLPPPSNAPSSNETVSSTSQDNITTTISPTSTTASSTFVNKTEDQKTTIPPRISSTLTPTTTNISHVTGGNVSDQSTSPLSTGTANLTSITPTQNQPSPPRTAESSSATPTTHTIGPTQDCGSFSISPSGYIILIHVPEQGKYTVYNKGDNTNITRTANLTNGNVLSIELDPCKTHKNLSLSVFKGKCKLKGNGNIEIQPFAEKDFRLAVNNTNLLCYEPQRATFKVEPCLDLQKSYTVGPVLPSVIHKDSNQSCGLRWGDKPAQDPNLNIEYIWRDGTKTVRLVDLLPNRNYSCTGTATCANNNSTDSAFGTITVEFKCYTTMNVMINSSSSTINISGTHNTSCEKPLSADNIKFNICCVYSKTEERAGGWCEEEKEIKKNLIDLKAFTNYSCSVKAIYKSKVTVETKNLTIQTSPGIPDNVTIHSINLVSNNEVKVSCKLNETSNGPYTYYIAEIKDISANDVFHTRNNTTCSFSVANLNYLTEYTLKVHVFNGKHHGANVAKTFSTKYNDKALIGFLAFFIVLVSVALLLVLYKIYLLHKRNSNNNDERMELICNNEDSTLLNVEPITADQLLDTYKKKIADDGRLFLAEFQSIPRVFSKTPIKEARKPCNQNKNRYIDILPYDDNRVHLTTGADGSDYINASFIDGYKEPRKYIAAQGPKNETVVDFWRMVWEQQSSVIVMVTRCEEGNRNKCAQYWPSMDRETEIFEDFVVKISTEDYFPDYIIRHLTVANKREKNSEREVTHIQFTSWPDHGVPGEPHLLLKLRRRVNSFKNLFSGPIVIHCSAGVGRTGTYIGIDAMMEGLEAEGRMDIYGYVVKLRRQRCLMVQVEAQYILIHQALIEHTQFGETEIPLSELHSTFNTLKQKDLGSEATLLELEFQRLPKYKNWRTCNTAICEENMKKNRYSTFVPYDYNRVLVKIEDEISHESDQEDDEDYSTDEDDEDGTRYINASYIDGYWGPRNLIAAQGPLPDTRTDFWQMIFQKKVKTVVMLTDCMEDGKEFCSTYWGDEKMVFGDIEVEMKDCNSCPAYETRYIEIRHSKRKESRKLYQYQFRRWTEQNIPENPRDLVDMMRSIRQKLEYDKHRPERNMPVVVHCHDGTTRTGIFCALWNILESADTEKLVDIFQVVKALRRGRQGMMLNFEHYQFLYESVVSTYPAQNGELKQNHSAVAMPVVDETKEDEKGKPEAGASGGDQQGYANPGATEQAAQGSPSANAQPHVDSNAEPPAATEGAVTEPEKATETPSKEEGVANGPDVIIEL
ncbi:receptor-type tyrosine-protein phosphatase C [Arapaima gigas]